MTDRTDTLPPPDATGAMREQLARLTGDMDDDTAARAALGDTDGR